MLITAMASLVLAALMMWLNAPTFSPMAYLGWVMAWWILLLHAYELHTRATHRHRFIVGVKKLQRSHWAMMLGHVGLAVSIIGIAMVQNYSIERDVRLAPEITSNSMSTTFTSKVCVIKMDRTTMATLLILKSLAKANMSIHCMPRNVSIAPQSQ